MDSLIVKDFDTAFTCSETLKELKLGRIRIIPIKGLLHNNRTNLKSQSAESHSLITNYINYAKQYQPVINYVFGDTYLASDKEAAVSIAGEAHRAVTVNGDLYEAGGGVEGGFYRSPIDFKSLVPSRKAVKNVSGVEDS